MFSLAAANPRNRGTCGIHDIAGRAGLLAAHRRMPSPQSICTYIEGLQLSFGFPRPYPSAKRGGGLTELVQPKSRWPQEAVDKWFDDRLPPDTAVALDTAAMRAAADDMDQRAAQLGRKRGHMQLVASNG